MPNPLTITEHTLTTERTTTSYLAAGPEDGPLVIFVHGWPELGLSWRHQLPALGAAGFRAIAPDLRGFGNSTVYTAHAAYALEEIVGDLLELLGDHDTDSAVWVGHDWGGPVVWSVASHYPERVRAVASLCVPFYTLERGLDACIDLVNRDVYPADRYPAGQWDYQLHYQESFAEATAQMDANPRNLVQALFRKGDPAGVGQPAATATMRRTGWFDGLPSAPDVPRDPDVVTEDDVERYAAALTRNGFFGPNALYMNHERNAAYATRAVVEGLEMPVLFLAAHYDYVCETVHSALADPMRARCADLTEHVLDGGHWLAQERPVEVNAALLGWLARVGIWPESTLVRRGG